MICQLCRRFHSGPSAIELQMKLTTPDMQRFCSNCQVQIGRAKELPRIEVVCLGQFRNGSFQTFAPGAKANDVVKYWAVKCLVNSGAFSAPGYTFTSELAATKFAASLREKYQAEADDRLKKLGYKRK
jgi:hypothetical protein